LTTLGSASSSNTLLTRLAGLTSPTERSGHPIHDLHPYPAKYIPRLPREVITEHTNERHTILDPFVGCGTTLVEAALLGRRSIGIDSNPIACLAARVKTTPLTAGEQLEARRFLKTIEAGELTKARKTQTAPFDGWQHWFQPNMAAELGWLKSQIDRETADNLRQFLLAVFSSIVTSVSNQDSDTRYKAVAKDLPDGYALRRFGQKLRLGLSAAQDYASYETTHRYVPTIHNVDTAELLGSVVPERSIDLIVTSPPYPNSYDYYLYHKLRMLWLGYDYRAVQAQEIGSRYEHSSRRASIDVFTTRMAPVMAGLARVLKPSKLAYLFVGDSVLAGVYYDMAEVYRDLADAAGFRFVDEAEYELNDVSRSFVSTRRSAGNGHGRSKLQRIVVLEGRASPSLHPVAPSTRLSARPAPVRPAQALVGVPPDGAVLALASEDAQRHIHSLGYYPSRFIPEIPRWAISQYSAPGNRVLDPFVGSGTTAVETLILDRESVACDVSPYSTLLTRAKTTRVSARKLDRYVTQVLTYANAPRSLPRERHERFELDDFWFDRRHLNQFASLRSVIEAEVPPDLQPFFLTVLASTIRYFSYQDRSQIKVKRDPKKVLQGTPTPCELLTVQLPRFADRLSQFNQLASKQPSKVRTASAETVAGIFGACSADLIVTSPPYINAMNYPMAHRYELVLLGLVAHEDLRSHQATYFGTERVYSRDYSRLHQVPSSWSIADSLNPRLEQIYAGEPKRAYIAYNYFAQMHAALAAMADALRESGRLVLIAGSNVIKGVPIDTFEMLVSLATDLGLTRETVFHYEIVKQAFKITRHDTASMIPHDGVAVLRKLG
jgi:DNA modification methylase